MIQVVGHSIAYCYHRSGLPPTPGHADCDRGLIRSTAGHEAICVDGGMFLGARTYMEIGSDGMFRTYERDLIKVGSLDSQDWHLKDLTSDICSRYLKV
jgi:hypothetical protein